MLDLTTDVCIDRFWFVCFKEEWVFEGVENKKKLSAAYTAFIL